MLLGASVACCLSILGWSLRSAEQWASVIGWQPVVLSTIFSSILAGLLLGAAGPLVWVTTASIPRLRALSRFSSALVGSFLLLGYFVLRGAGEMFFLVNDAPLDLGTWEFVAGASSHLLTPLFSDYLYMSLGLLATASLVTASCVRFLARPPSGSLSVLALTGRGLASLVALISLLHILTTPGVAAGAGLFETADLSFLASVGDREKEEREDHLESAELKGLEAGAALSSGKLWTNVSAKMGGPRPNVLLIVMESVGLSHLGYEGYSRATTPNLDRIAERSVRYRKARTTATHSNYAQMAILSSLFPRRYSGLDTYRRLDYPRVLWHDLLTSLGYATATHSSQDESWQGMRRFQKTQTPTEFNHSGNYEGEKISIGSEKIVPDEVTAQRAIEWIGKTSGAWGLYVNLQSTHFPYRIPKSARSPYVPNLPTRGKFRYLNYPKEDLPVVVNRYDNALTYVDEQIGRIYEYLEETGRLRDTLIVVSSDHGELFWDHGMVTHGRSLYEEELRVPLLVHYPAQLPATDVDDAVSTLDILPTIADILKVPPHPAFQGRSLLRQNEAVRRPVFMNIQGMKSQDGVVCNGYKFINNRSSGKWELFELDSDPHEQHNLVDSLPTRAQALHRFLHRQMAGQMSYHSPRETQMRMEYYAPRFALCPLESTLDIDAQDMPSPVADAALSLN